MAFSYEAFGNRAHYKSQVRPNVHLLDGQWGVDALGCFYAPLLRSHPEPFRGEPSNPVDSEPTSCRVSATVEILRQPGPATKINLLRTYASSVRAMCSEAISLNFTGKTWPQRVCRCCSWYIRKEYFYLMPHPMLCCVLPLLPHLESLSLCRPELAALQAPSSHCCYTASRHYCFL